MHREEDYHDEEKLSIIKKIILICRIKREPQKANEKIFFSYIVSAIRGHSLAQITALLRKEVSSINTSHRQFFNLYTSIFQTALIIVFPHSGYVLEDWTQRVLKKAKKKLKDAFRVWSCTKSVKCLLQVGNFNRNNNFEQVAERFCCYLLLFTKTLWAKSLKTCSMQYCHSLSQWMKTVNTAPALQCSPFQ